MSNFEFDFLFDGEWDDFGNITWNETDWQKYFKGKEKEITKFVSLYLKLKIHPQRLDIIASHQEWRKDDWPYAVNTPEITDAPDVVLWEFQNIADLNNAGESAVAPYTVYDHPLYIGVKGLYVYVRKFTELVIRENPNLISSSAAWKLSSLFMSGEHLTYLSTNAYDIEDYELAICYFKNGLSVINEILGCLDQISKEQTKKSLKHFNKELRLIIFDIRDIWLRAISKSRECINYDYDDDLGEELD